MHRIIGLLPRRQMAAGVAAIRRLNVQAVVAVDMAQRALHVGVPVGQQKSRRAMVEFPVRPLGDRMAGGARRRRRRETRRNMIRHTPANRLRAIPVRRVARHAIGAAQRVVVIDVARNAWGRRR